MERFDVVVVGGGAVGCAALYHLAKRGRTDVLLLEADELTSGSTWHAAGNCPTFAASWGVLRLQKYSADLFARLGDEVGYPITYHRTGSLRLALTGERVDEFRHVAGMARANGIAYETMAPAEAAGRFYPYLETDGVLEVLWDPMDGDIDPSQLTQAFAKGARDLGALIRRGVKVTGLRPDGPGWVVETPSGEVGAGAVVNAAGYRAGEVMALLGRHLPTAVMAHQYLVSEDLPELAARAGTLPILRDPDTSYYLRQERHGLLLGPYEWGATPMWREGLPEGFAYGLFEDDLDRLEPYIEAACARVPLLGQAGVKRVINGPIPYAPDGNPYVGPAPGLRNFYHANTFSFGIAQSAGAGKALAEWVIDGRPEWDLWALDPRRYTGYATRTFTTAKAVEVYQNEYAQSFPHEERLAGRPLRASPLYHRLEQKGARFGVRGGWERAVYVDPDGVVGEDKPHFRRDRPWFPLVAAEVAAVRGAVGVLDLPGFTKVTVEGPGAEAFLDRLLCSRLPKVGRVGLAYALDGDGRVWSEFTVTRLAADRFYLIAAAAAEWHDLDLLRGRLPDDGSVTLRDLSAAWGTLVVAGPRARDLLKGLTPADLSNAAFPWLSARRIDTDVAPILALRVSYVGELGWELHAPAEYLVPLYARIEALGEPLGLRDFGLYAMDSMRLDKGYPAWKADLETGYTPFDASLDRFVDLAKPDFVGRAALLEERARGPAWRLVPLVLDDPGDADAPFCAPVYEADARVGLVTSGGWSHTLNQSLALAYVRPRLAAEGTRLAVDVLGGRRPATVAGGAPFDPGNGRLRG
ncbi:MAG: GcvT family protein [Geminicoccaceae bacterium]|nr:GcvT family protein [Geminicoccaceae bacterium]